MAATLSNKVAQSCKEITLYLPATVDQAKGAIKCVHKYLSLESPLRLTAHGGFGERDGETRLSQGWKLRPVPTLRISGGGSDPLADCNLPVHQKPISEACICVLPLS
jgi:hypothetical protein